MSDAPEKQQAAAGASTSAAELNETAKVAPGSPARSDKSSDSEGKNVREKFKDTQIDAHATSDPVPSSDQAMKDAPNGTAKVGEQSASGSDTERGRLRRKRSHEDFEEDTEAAKLPGKKADGHKRKRSRDITKDIETFVPSKPVSPTIAEEDEQMTSPSKNTATTTTTDKASGTDTSPKNKRTRDQIEKDAEVTAEGSEAASANGKPVEKAGDERDTKRLRDKEGAQSATGTTQSKTKITPGSGFTNTSAASPFTAMGSMGSKPQASKTSDKTESLPQTSADQFKKSGFGSFANSASPFEGFKSSKPSSSSVFGAATAGKLSTFAGSPVAPTTTKGGFGSGGFGGSTFGGSIGNGFGSFLGSNTGANSFATTGSLEIKGLKSTNKDTPFGANQLGEESEDDDGNEEDPEDGTEKEERQTGQALLSQQQPHETGEEGEDTVWTGRAKLYTMTGEATSRAWKERGTGTFKFNVTSEAPKRARFVLRAEGTHRLLLNARVTRDMVFGEDAQGEKPKDMRLLFNSPNAEGELEMHLLKLKHENAVNLWEQVTQVQEEQL